MSFHIILLSLSTIIWGFGFVAARLTFESYDPFWAHGLRFILAALFGLPIMFYFKSFTKKNTPWKEGFIAAIFLFGTLIFQTVGLSYTTVAKSGFITTLYSFFVPMTMMILYKKKFHASFWGLVLMAILGVSLLCNLEFNDLNYGDFLMLICSLFASFHIIYIGKVAPHVPSPVELNLIQNVFMGIMGVLLALVVKGPVHLHPLLDFKSHTFLGLMFLSLISSLIAFSIQVVAQKRIPSHIAGLIFLLESPFAALFGYLIFHEKLNMMSCIGAGLILLSVVLVPVLGREVTTPIKEGHPKKTKKT